MILLGCKIVTFRTLEKLRRTKKYREEIVIKRLFLTKAISSSVDFEEASHSILKFKHFFAIIANYAAGNVTPILDFWCFFAKAFVNLPPMRFAASECNLKVIWWKYLSYIYRRNNTPHHNHHISFWDWPCRKHGKQFETFLASRKS